MTAAAALVADSRFITDAIMTSTYDAAGWRTAFAAATDDAQRAALIIVAGRTGLTDIAQDLIGALDHDGIYGRSLAWTLGTLANKDGELEGALVNALAEGSFDVRENAYLALAILAARGMATASLAPAMRARVDAEIERAKSGGTGLGEHACRVLAVLGDGETPTLIQRVIDQDRFCDRFELQRLRKAVEDDGGDIESRKLFAAPWVDFFAEHLAPAVVAEPPANAPTAEVPPAQQHADATTASGQTTPADNEADLNDDGDNPDEAAPQPINWKDFAESPELKALPAQLTSLATQLGPLLEQLSVRAIRAPLSDLNAQEFIALLLQVLPQALPPQHVQMALSPQALSCYKAVITYLMRTGVATNGQALLDGLKMVRQELTNQIRQAGILGGPDYSDPDEKSPVVDTK